ncbi:protein FAR1-RELATED SEQUENCE 5-like [Carica papaya]|uniref:protein FAR1-RELATED SEQUENCE 5-like n=1 Tax=Carica papaya TaxID=3649 RepID=UPI000B8D0DD0|nr:protein FAR1-RELATED SEQUENCE 5-like [Carica papaya]
MPFAPFTGVNHHRQSVLFGCALLADETESTFIWLFTTWLEAVSGRQPGLIITDYDSAISRAVEKVFPQSRHRYCKWHIMSKMPKEMGNVYSSLPKTFQVEFDRCVNKSETPEEFECAWQLLLEKFNLRGNEWLQSLYIDRKLWVSTYVRDTFFAGMYSTQRSASVSSLFDGYVTARTTLQDFAEQYEKALDDRYEKEAKAEFETFYTRPILKTPLPMEKQASEVYTRKLFSIFQEEIFESIVLAVKLSGDDGGTRTYEVARFDEKHRVYFVALSISEQIASCSCKMFEFEGILCRHVIAIYKMTNVFVLPKHYILKRWTKNVKDEAMLDMQPCMKMQDNSQKSKNSQYNILYQEALRCAEEGMTSDHIFKVALSALQEARNKIIDAKKNAINPSELETIACASYQDENTKGASQVDSSSVLLTSSENQKASTGGSSEEDNISKYTSEQSSNRVGICTNCNCPDHESHDCLWLKDSSQDTSMVQLVGSSADDFI